MSALASTADIARAMAPKPTARSEENLVLLIARQLVDNLLGWTVAGAVNVCVPILAFLIIVEEDNGACELSDKHGSAGYHHE
jgi:hypothetical protein